VDSWTRSTPNRTCGSCPIKSQLQTTYRKLTPIQTRAKAIWDFEGINCSSRHIPGVKFAGLIHPGILGCAPSPEILATWNEREGGLIKACAHMDRDVAMPPEPKNVHAGTADSSTKEKVGQEGARTVPGRPEHGGNCDIKNLSRGSKVYLPVHVKGAKFSVGDLHFSQGDGEISFCGAIEMAGVITINFSVMKGGMEQLAMKSPIYVPGPVEPQFGPGRYIYFEGFSVDEHGKQHYLDATVAYRQTCLRVIEYLRRYGQLIQESIRTREPHTDCLFTRRLRRLPDLPPPVLCPDPGPHCGYCRHPQCLHHYRKTTQHLFMRPVVEKTTKQQRMLTQ
jgi:acetamidase/formamidase